MTTQEIHHSNCSMFDGKILEAMFDVMFVLESLIQNLPSDRMQLSSF